MNNKLNRVNLEIQKTQEKILELQDKVKELTKQKIEIENLEIIGLIRGAKITPENLPSILKSFQLTGDIPLNVLNEEDKTYEEK